MTVIVTDSAVTISSLTLENPDLVQYFRQCPENERPKAAIRAFEIGVFCLQRTQMGHGLDFVRLEIERLIQSAESAIANIPTQVELKLGGETGPLAPIRTSVAGAQNAIHQKLNEVAELFNQHLDPANADATLGKALSAVKELITPGHPQSVQDRIESSITSITQHDGTLTSAVQKAVENATSSLRQAVDTLTLALAGKKGAEEAIGETTKKGFEFEEELISALRDWAVLVGAEFEHVGPKNFPGDFVLKLKDTAIGAAGLKFVIEARDREDGWGKARITEHMNDALKQWNGNYGIYVSKTQAGLAQEIGEWLELSCESGPFMACTVEHLRTALRFALVDYKFRELQKASREIDATSITSNLTRFRTSLNHLTQIKRKVTDIENILGNIKNEADTMRIEIDDTLQNIESSLPR